jgi:signal transduction histidine kinase
MRRLLLPGAALGLLALLIGLGVLQHGWLTQLAQAEKQRLQASAAERARALAAELDREVSRAFLLLGSEADLGRVHDGKAMAARIARWRETAPHPELLARVWLAEPRPSGGYAAQLFEGEGFQASSWPPAWAALASASAAGPLLSLSPGMPPALVVPVAPFSLPPHPRGDRVVVQRLALSPSDWPQLIVEFDEAALRSWLPGLAHRHLGGVDGPEFEARIVEVAGGRELGRTAAYPDGPPDVAVPLLRLALDDLDRALLPDLLGHERAGAPLRVRIATLRSPGEGAPEPARFRLELRHHQGSIDQAVATLARRQSALGLGLLSVLAGGLGLIVLAARRASRLAARQLEFVAGVTHELRTPLAVIRGAADNLASGVVSEPEQVRRYGSELSDQGRRLSRMVEEVLALAALEQPARLQPRWQPLSPLVDEAVAAAGLRADEVAREGCEVPGDAAALVRALSNLLANARLHGGPAARIAVRAERAGREVRLLVSDDGPGLEPGERSAVLEPFVRGRRALEEQRPGSGLGLTLVQRIAAAHGGRLAVRSAPGQGATFTLHLPVLR